MRKSLFLAAPAVLLGFLAILGWWQLVPRDDPRPLPPDLVGLTTPEGQALLADAEASADYPPLSSHFEAQALRSYCGVASGVIVLSALGRETSQKAFFVATADNLRPRWRVVLTGMPLADLGMLLAAHDVGIAVHHASDSSPDSFRRAVQANLGKSGDYLIVNYQREVLGQEATGHISPLAAYDADTDRVLVMDTASYKYPPTWVPIEKLFAAMNTIDSETGRTRGYVEVTATP